MRKRLTRLTEPLVRENGVLRSATWAEALDRLFSCSKATNEVNFMTQKFARVVMGTNNVDSCNRT
jgi:formate dehydrogenase major subunit